MHKWLILFALLASPTVARDFSDPSWPCIQRKVERLSYGVVWPEVIEEEAQLSDAANTLAQKLALRRVTLEEATKLVADYTATNPAQESYGQVFLQAFTRMDRDRTRLVRGIERFSLAQVALSKRIEGLRAEMETQMAEAEPNYDKVDALEEQLDWDVRIFKDRQSVLTYVCESPVLLEKRIFAIGKLLMEARG